MRPTLNVGKTIKRLRAHMCVVKHIEGSTNKREKDKLKYIVSDELNFSEEINGKNS